MSALLIIDVQNDFLPGGALPVKGGNRILPVIRRLIPQFHHVLATQDWHPHNHISFGNLWPIHCVQNTWGAEFAPSLDSSRFEAVFRKGSDPSVDSYSAFYDTEGKKATELDAYLKKLGITDLYFAGLATDYCVLHSALDALKLGYRVSILRDACQGLHETEKALAKLKRMGAQITSSRSQKRG